jgi:DNA-binding MarR family transcriptional regulator
MDSFARGSDRIMPKAEKLFDILARFMLRTLTLRLLREVAGGVITWPQWEALVYVRRHKACSVSDLAKGLRVSQPAATKLVERLVLKGYVVRGENPADRRACCITLSESGVRLVDSIGAEREGRFSFLIRGMDEERRVALISGLSGFLEKALGDEETASEVCLQCGTEHEPDCLVSQARAALAS